MTWSQNHLMFIHYAVSSPECYGTSLWVVWTHVGIVRKNKTFLSKEGNHW